jgi:hypothetical protein
MRALHSASEKTGLRGCCLLLAALIGCVVCGRSRASGSESSPAKLEQPPEISKSIAEAMVRSCEKSGPFERVEDLLVVRGISKGTFAKLRPFVTVSRAAERSQ